MPTCPNGHRSEGGDRCAVCGAPLSPATGPGPTTAAEACPRCGTPREGRAAFCEECRHDFPGGDPLPVGYGRTTSRGDRPAETFPPDATVGGGPTPRARAADDDGDFLLPPPAPPATASTGPYGWPEPHEESPEPGPEAWTAVVGADQAYYTAMMARSGPEASGLSFPSASPEQYVPLTGEEFTIGRRRHSGGGHVPDIDLSRAPEDPGVSHRHALLVRRPDGGWSVVDQDSTNGTTVNLGAEPITPFQPVELADGDQVHVGAWTTITLRRG
ncbi:MULTISPECIES: FHA domain-containing protein [Streptomycetaceae]|uniref:FHA domain-containing protein n=1 Tax=Streptantibioticus cattleyicolor (strain ATCC 35852 / DSM 46488 / JCM 4925 / NBRC 14057 / NRRL 8057) TaxID=1003195 RepID=F8JS36_STREN|nr:MULTISPECIES: FHA domain-containing protein [Streptomycetaceae]AEW94146.1 hypothetical protein SCATT_17750 [Streptantibioticus cattleyicolor NRRL 8057 = DSM 46488]MYS58811.1 FHA domain-containing protein [Streptomyces sp. SID5468]CCB74500.1 conserved protein of unknown function [Streptantibioticus cattleyicolor NRRL 8057 = DSM 46488]